MSQPAVIIFEARMKDLSEVCMQSLVKLLKQKLNFCLTLSETGGTFHGQVWLKIKRL